MAAVRSHSRRALPASLATWIALAVLGCGLSAGPATDSPPGVSPPTSEAAPGATPSALDLSAAIERVRANFRRRPAGLEAFGAGHAVRIDDRGGVAITAGPATDGSALLLQTQLVSRTGRPWRPDTPLWEPDAYRVTVAADGAEAVEVLENRADGLHQSWTFDRRPRGVGPLVVRVATAGCRQAVIDYAGVHLQTDGGALRYGHGTFVDGKGERTPIRVQWASGELRLEVPAAVIDSASYPAVLDPVVGPEIEVAPPHVPPSAVQPAERPKIGWNGSQYLAAWFETRTWPYTLVGVRIDATGAVLDPIGMELAPARTYASTGSTGADGKLSIVGTPTGHLVIYTYVNAVNHWVAVSGDGHVSSPAMLTPSAELASHTTAVAAPYGALVAYRGGSGLGAVLALRVGPDGSLLDPAPLQVLAPPDIQVAPAIAVAIGHALIAWQTGDERVLGRRLRHDGAWLDPSPRRLVAAGARRPAVATDGVDALLVWIDRRNEATDGLDLYGRQVFADGSAGVVRRITAARGDEVEQALVVDGDRYVLAYVTEDASGYGLELLQLDRSGRSIDGAPLRLLDGLVDSPHPALTAGAQVVLTYEIDQRIEARFIDPPLSPRGPLVLSRSAPAQHAPKVAWGGDQYLIAWTDWTLAGWEGQVVRAARDGRVLDAMPTSVTDGVIHSVTHGRDGFIIGWSRVDEADHYRTAQRVTRVDAAGMVLDPAGLPVAGGPDETVPAMGVAHDGDHFLAAWISDPDGSGERIARAARIDDAGAILDVPPLELLRGPDIALGFVVVAAIAGQHLVVVAGQYEGRAIRVEAGRILDPTGLVVAGGHLNRGLGHGDEYLVLGDGAVLRIGARTGDVSTLAAPSALTPQPSVATHDGLAYLVAGRHVSGVFFDSLQGHRFRSNGEVLDAEPFPLATTTTSIHFPELASPGDATSLLAYTTHRPEAPYGNERLWLRIIQGDRLEDGEPCSNDGLCLSRACVDGVCCADRCGAGSSDDCAACSLAAGGSTDGHCTPVVAGLLCRAVDGECDRPEVCDGSEITCPPDGWVDDDTPCSDDGLICDGVARCVAGVCDSPGELDCDDGDPTTIDHCVEGVGCQHTDSPMPRDAGTTPAADAGQPPMPPDAGQPPAPPDAGQPPAPRDAGGCGCRLAPRRAAGQAGLAFGWAAWFLVALLARRGPPA